MFVFKVNLISLFTENISSDGSIINNSSNTIVLTAINFSH